MECVVNSLTIGYTAGSNNSNNIYCFCFIHLIDNINIGMCTKFFFFFSSR